MRVWFVRDKGSGTKCRTGNDTSARPVLAVGCSARVCETASERESVGVTP